MIRVLALAAALMVLSCGREPDAGRSAPEAEERLDEKFDLKEFHDLILENGAVPVAAMRSHVEAVRHQKTWDRWTCLVTESLAHLGFQFKLRLLHVASADIRVSFV